MLQRTEAIQTLADHRGDALSVACMQSIVPWHEAQQASQGHIDATGCMGSASSIGLGLALGRPNRHVWVLDGDGSLLMQLGSLVTVAGLAPTNLYHFVFANGLYQSTGNQPLPGRGVFDACGLALSAGYRRAARYDDAATLRDDLPAILAAEGPSLIELTIEPEDGPPRWARVPMAAQVQTLREELSVSA
jgi:phosphonopyruvate decarboxylase